MKLFFLGGEKAWSSQEIITLCEKLSGQKAKVKLVPITFLKLLRLITGFFEMTSKISERLAFVQFLQESQEFPNSLQTSYQIFKIKQHDLLSLEAYLREYFEMMLVSLENFDIKNQNKQKDLIL